MMSVRGRPALHHNWASLAVVLIAALLVVLAFKSGLDAGMASGRIEPSWRHRIFGIPIVLSQLYYGRPYDYVGYKTIETYFEPEDASIDDLALRLKSIPNVESGGLFYILADDKGVVDYVRLAFSFYGVRTSSLYYMYFTIFSISCLLFAISFFGDRHKLAVLVLLCLAVYVTMPAFVMFPPGINILDLHAFGILTLPAVLHILLTATEGYAGRVAVITAVVQVLIITLNHHIRASTFSQTIAIVCGCPILLYLSTRTLALPASPRFSWRRAFAQQRLLPVTMLVLAVGLLPVYKRVMYNRGYFGTGAMVNRPVYHNLLIGLGFNPVLQRRYDLGLGDLGAARAVDRFLRRKDPSRHDPNWAASGMNTTTTQLPFDWNEYEAAARDLYFTIWRRQPWECFLTIAYYHPVDAYRIAHYYLGHTGPSHLTAAFAPLRPAVLSVLLIVTMLCTIGGRPMPAAHVVVASALFLSALIPLILVYAGGFIIMAEAFVAAELLVYTALAVFLSRFLARIIGAPMQRLQTVGVV
jgi:hypothetical protein